jgi:hypothetical protein
MIKKNLYKKKLKPLKDHYIHGITEKPKPTQSESDDLYYRYGDFRDEIIAVERLKQKDKL